MSDARVKAALRRLAERRRRDSKGSSDKGWTHTDLVFDLAEFHYGNKIVFAEVGVGSRWMSGGDFPVPDVFTLEKSYVKPSPTIYEVKVNRSDYLADVRSDKWMKYLRLCRRFYFAAPSGLIKKTEVPKDAGLIVRGPREWKVVRAPRVQKKVDLNHFHMMSLLMAGAYTGMNVRKLRELVDLGENVELGNRVRGIGYEIGRAISKLEKGDAAGSPAGQEVLEAVASVLGVTVMELIEMGSWEVAGRLLDAKIFEREIELVHESVRLLEGRWRAYGGIEQKKKRDGEMRSLEKDILATKKRHRKEKLRDDGQSPGGEAGKGIELQGEEVC